MDAWKDAGYPTAVQKTPKKKVSRGADLYAANCLSCHQANGQGLTGEFPPLAGNMLVNAADPRPAIKVVLDGMAGTEVGGVHYRAVMPGFRQKLADDEVAEILSYVRTSWGNTATKVSAADVKARR